MCSTILIPSGSAGRGSSTRAYVLSHRYGTNPRELPQSRRLVAMRNSTNGTLVKYGNGDTDTVDEQYLTLYVYHGAIERLKTRGSEWIDLEYDCSLGMFFDDASDSDKECLHLRDILLQDLTSLAATCPRSCDSPCSHGVLWIITAKQQYQHRPLMWMGSDLPMCMFDPSVTSLAREVQNKGTVWVEERGGKYRVKDTAPIISQVFIDHHRIIPSTDDLMVMNSNELSKVQNLCVENDNGLIRFLDPVDIRRLNFCETFRIEKTGVDIFYESPSQFEHITAHVALKVSIADEKCLERFKSQCSVLGVKFLKHTNDEVWFEVTHFSGYHFKFEDEEACYDETQSTVVMQEIDDMNTDLVAPPVHKKAKRRKRRTQKTQMHARGGFVSKSRKAYRMSTLLVSEDRTKRQCLEDAVTNLLPYLGGVDIGQKLYDVYNPTEDTPVHVIKNFLRSKGVSLTCRTSQFRIDRSPQENLLRTMKGLFLVQFSFRSNNQDKHPDKHFVSYNATEGIIIDNDRFTKPRYIEPHERSLKREEAYKVPFCNRTFNFCHFVQKKVWHLRRAWESIMTSIDNVYELEIMM